MNIYSDMKTRLQGTIIVPSTVVPGAAGTKAAGRRLGMMGKRRVRSITKYTISSNSGAGNEGSVNLVESESAL